MRTKLRHEQHEREQEQTHHVAMLRELQQMLGMLQQMLGMLQQMLGMFNKSYKLQIYTYSKTKYTKSQYCAESGRLLPEEQYMIHTSH